MIRRFASYLLIAGYLSGQLAAVPHAHAGLSADQQACHDVCPHVHCSWFAFLLGCEHDHGGKGNHSRSSDSDSNSALSPEGHDSNAIYLPNEAGAPSLTAKSVVSLDNFQLASPQACSTLSAVTAIPTCWANGIFLGQSNLGCPLYLALRALRI